MAKQIQTKASKSTIDVNVKKSRNNNFPSKITDSYWVHASVKQELNHLKKLKIPNTGKWLIFLDIKELDKTWQSIKNATESGFLGIGAKAATARPNPNAISQDEKVICVYTYNWQDIDDVYRVEKILRLIRITQTLFYKADSDTLQGKYKINGSTGISKYISKESKNLYKLKLESLNGISCAKLKILKKVKINTVDNLLLFDTNKNLSGTGISSEYINRLKLSAMCQIEQKIYRLSPWKFPKKNFLHFDIETEMNTAWEITKVWSIAVHYKENVIHFYAETWQQEKKILTDFLNYLKKYKSAALFSYSGFDVGVLKYALKRHNLDVDFFLNLNHYDLCAIIKQNYIFPLAGYGLKEIGRFMGYKFMNPYYDGFMASREYMRSQRLGEIISNELLNYIEDDVKVMDHIITQLQIEKNIKNLFDIINR